MIIWLINHPVDHLQHRRLTILPPTIPEPSRIVVISLPSVVLSWLNIVMMGLSELKSPELFHKLQLSQYVACRTRGSRKRSDTSIAGETRHEKAGPRERMVPKSGDQCDCF